MGVFARLLGRSKATREASAAAAKAGTQPVGAGAEESRSAAPRAKGVGAARVPGSSGREGEGSGQDADEGRADVAARQGADAEDASEGSGIPRQQSAEEAADSETGEGVRK